MRDADPSALSPDRSAGDSPEVGHRLPPGVIYSPDSGRGESTRENRRTISGLLPAAIYQPRLLFGAFFRERRADGERARDTLGDGREAIAERGLRRRNCTGRYNRR